MLSFRFVICIALALLLFTSDLRITITDSVQFLVIFADLILQDNKLPECSIQMFAQDLVAGLQYIHSKGIVYCDLKPSNILFNSFGSLKYCDFGFARKINDLKDYLHLVLKHANVLNSFSLLKKEELHVTWHRNVLQKVHFTALLLIFGLLGV